MLRAVPSMRLGASVLVLGLLLLPACGGGGGGAPIEAPGTLRTVAREGDPAPGTLGSFAALPIHPLMDAADGGYCAFVAPTTDVAAAQVLYAVLPDAAATLVRVYAKGDTVPAPSDGAIASFQGVWVTESGVVVALVTLTGDSSGRAFGVISARVAGGAVTEQSAVIYDGDDLSGADGTGALAGLDPDTMQVVEDGTCWFLGQDGAMGDVDLWSVARDGSGLQRRAWVGFEFKDQFGTIIATATSIDAFGVHADGSMFCFVAGKSSGGRTMVVRASNGSGMPNDEFFSDGQTLPGGGTVTDVHKGGRILVYTDGIVIWVAQGSFAGNDDVLMLFEPGGGYIALARSGFTAPNTGMGTLSTIDMANAGKTCVYPSIRATVTGSANGVTAATYGVIGATGSNLVMDSANLVTYQGANVPASWVDLGRLLPPDDEAASDGSAAFIQSYAGLTTLFWVIRGQTTFTIATSGETTPGGDTFGSFAGGAGLTVANGSLLFRASLLTAGSGLFRRGP